MKKTVIFGAGQIGRGFIGDICSSSGYRLVFVDAVKEVVDLLNLRKEYPLWLLSEKKVEKNIRGFKALDFSLLEEVAEEVSEVELVFTAVGANNLASLAPVLAEGIKRKSDRQKGSHINVVICENLLGGSKILREKVEKLLSPARKTYLRKNVGFVETVVSRMVAPIPDIFREKHPLLVTVEPYNILPVAKKDFKGEVPGINGFYPVENIFPYEELKLFVHNLAHAALAYTGFLAGHTFIWECMENKRIYGILEGVLKETREAIMRKHDFDRQEVDDYIADLYSRFRNRALNDTVNRVGRDPLRKMGEKDRIAGAMKLCLRQNIFPGNICFVMAACLCYNYPEDKTALQLQEILSDKGVDYAIKSIALIDDGPVIEKVKAIYKEIKSDSSYFKGA